MKRRVTAVIFDIDGTLTVPAYDFKEWRLKLAQEFPNKFGIGTDLLAEAQTLSPRSRDRALGMIHEWEEEGRAKLKLQAGVLETLRLLDERAIPRGVITRNTKHTVEALNDHLANLAFRVSVDRSFEPPKPNPLAALHLLKLLGVTGGSTQDVLFVGDSHDDVLCAQGAMMTSVFIRNRHEHFEERFTKHGHGADEGAHFAFDTMDEFRGWLFTSLQ